MKKCEKHFGDNIAYLDIGCIGGGLVFDFAITSKRDQIVMQFHVVSAWDILEHLSVGELQALF